MTENPTPSPSVRIFTDVDMREPQPLRLPGAEAVVFSRRSPEKSQNQDAAGCFLLDAGGVLVVADGLGGQPGGASASRLALESLGTALSGVTDRASAARTAILDGLEEANRQVLDLGIGAGTTLAAAEVFVDTLRPYHVGDSEILVVGQRGRIKLHTVSHSPVEVGSPLSLARRDTVLLATDGVFDNLRLPEIVDTIRVKPLERVAVRLAEVARRRMEAPTEGLPSKPDDLTFILYRRA
jgi:serine/threonine protein phosphatase PrpC